jgi:hypothetical protein
MNRLRRNWLLMLDEPRYRGDRGTVVAAPTIDGDTLIIDMTPTTLRVNSDPTTLVVDITPTTVRVG